MSLSNLIFTSSYVKDRNYFDNVLVEQDDVNVDFDCRLILTEKKPFVFLTMKYLFDLMNFPREIFIEIPWRQI